MVQVGRIHDRRAFSALRRSRLTASAGPLRVAFAPPPPAHPTAYPLVGYAISRRCGNAVARNRLRRRLRAAVVALDRDLPAGAYLVTPRPAATELPYVALAGLTARALTALDQRGGPVAERGVR